MLSDEWIAAGYSAGETIWIVPILVSCKYWETTEKERVGVSVSFHYSNDTHCEIAIDEWNKFIETALTEYTGSELQKLEDFFGAANRRFSLTYHFEMAMRQNNIKYRVISFHDNL